MNKLEKDIIQKTKQAIYDFDMIQDGDRLLLGVSGGKDSMLLGYVLKELRRTMKQKFEMRAVYMFKEFLIDCDIQFEEKRKYYEEELGIPLEKVNIKLPENSAVNDEIWQSCQWCAYSRRVSMMKICKEHNLNKIVYGHHLDDIVTTTFMNLSQGRNLKIMPPLNKMLKGETTFIRPLAYVREMDIKKLCIEKWIPFSPCSCPVWETTMRNKIKYELWELEKKIPDFMENSFYGLVRDFKEKYKPKNYIVM